MEISIEKPQQPETSEFVEQAAEMSQVFLADDADDDEEEVEPKLKYERLSNDIAHILKKDASSCIAVHPKVLLESEITMKSFLKVNIYNLSLCALEQNLEHYIFLIILVIHLNSKNFLPMVHQSIWLT